MSRRWVIADTHLGHANIIDYASRPFENVEQMNKVLIDNWNKVVGQNDTVYMLGDFALCGRESIIRYGQLLKGHKTLIMGNHDNWRPEVYYAAGFRYVSKHPILLEERYLLSHRPMFHVTKESGLVNIYGHVHDSENYKDYTNSTFCASVERIHYRPINFDLIRKKVRNYKEEENGKEELLCLS